MTHTILVDKWRFNGIADQRDLVGCTYSEKDVLIVKDERRTQVYVVVRVLALPPGRIAILCPVEELLEHALDHVAVAALGRPIDWAVEQELDDRRG